MSRQATQNAASAPQTGDAGTKPVSLSALPAGPAGTTGPGEQSAGEPQNSAPAQTASPLPSDRAEGANIIIPEPGTEIVEMCLRYDSANPAVAEEFRLNGVAYVVPYDDQYHPVPLGVYEQALSCGKAIPNTAEDRKLLPPRVQPNDLIRRTVANPNGALLGTL